MGKLKKKSVKDLIGMFPQSVLAKIGSDTQVDWNVSRLYGDRMFKLLLFASLRSYRVSTRILEEFYKSPFFSAFSGKGKHTTSHSSIASRLSKMNPLYFQKIFEWAVKNFRPQLAGTHLFKRIKRFDSTMIALGGALVEWGMRVGCPPKQGKGKVQLKLTMSVHGHLPDSLECFFEQEHLSEEKALKEAILNSGLKKGDLVVFDRGLKSRKTLISFDEQGIQFVTAGSTNTRYEVQEEYRNIKGRTADGLRFIQDSKVYLYGTGNKLIEHPFRLIEAEIIETGERITFITNVWDLSAMDIARVYRHRWDIEVFFRFIKQQLNIKHLINRSENGVQIQIYTALIAAILILVFKISNQIKSYTIAKIRFEEHLLLLIVNELKERPPDKTGKQGFI